MPRALIGNFKGPKGDKGDTGPQGIQGPRGPQGEQGVIDSSSTVDFTQAYSRVNINSGESCATLFGKIKKYFADLKAVAFTGSYNDLSNKPTLGTAASKGVANSLSITSSGQSLLDAAQGKVLNDKKFDKANITNNLLATVSGFALDARQGKILNDKITKTDKNITDFKEKIRVGFSTAARVEANEMVKLSVQFPGVDNIDSPVYKKVPGCVLATLYNSQEHTAEVAVAEITADGFTALIKNTSDANYFKVYWLAIWTD